MREEKFWYLDKPEFYRIKCKPDGFLKQAFGKEQLKI